MNHQEFSERIADMMQTLYRVSYSQLNQPHDRDEAVQECLCKAWKKLHQLKDEKFLQSWVIRILINECHNVQRRRKREVPTEELPERIVPPDANAELHDALLALHEKYRLPIVLHYIEGFQVGEIAYMLRLPEGTVKSHMLRGRQLLRNDLSEEGAAI